MTFIAECCNCSRVSRCSKTGFAKVLKSFTCEEFEPADEIQLLARSQMFQAYGLATAVRVLLKRLEDPNQELASMSIELPAQGTPYGERKKQLEIMSFMDVRILGNRKYKDQNGNPILDWNDTLTSDKREQSIQRVLEFELLNNLIVPDAAAPQSPPQGAPAMAQSPYQPPQMPQMPMPTAPPQPAAPPQFGAPPPFGMAPMAPPVMGPPTMPAPPNFPTNHYAPPPAASPAQAAQAGQEATQPAAPAGGKKKRGAAAAPPPPPPPPNPTPPAQPQPTQFMAPPQAPPGFMPQQPPQAPTQPMQFAPPQFTPNAAPPPQAVPSAGVDLGPALSKIDAVGQAINAMGAADEKSNQKILATIEELKNLQLVQIACLQHIYLGQPHLAPSVADKGLTDVPKFIAYIQQFLPR